MVDDIDDPRRQEPAFGLDERAMLEAWLEFHRTTLLLKCEHLDDAERKRRPVPTSMLSLHGLLRHMAEVERNWFRCVLLREPDAPSLWYDPAVAVVLTSELVTNAIRLAEHLDLAAAAAHTLDDTGLRFGEPCSLRWIYAHMIEEYARHNGHADLIRELVDGNVGC